MQTLHTQLLELLTLEPIAPLHFRGKSHHLFGQRVFGGQILAQAIMAASQTSARPVHSLHAYFIRPGNAHFAIDYHVQILRDGHNFSLRQVQAYQQHSLIFTGLISMSIEYAEFDYQMPMPTYPQVTELISEQQHRFNIQHEIPTHLRENFLRPFQLDIRPVEFCHPYYPMSTPNYAEYIKTYVPIDQNAVALHQAIAAYYSDYSLLNVALNSLQFSYLQAEINTASLDHSLYFHRDFRVDEWMLYDLHCPAAQQGRGLNQGYMWQNGLLICTAIQESLIRIQTPHPHSPSQKTE